MFMLKKNRLLLEQIHEYLDTCDEVLHDFVANLGYYFANGPDAHFNKAVNEIHGKESRADDIRHKIELDLFEKSLLPETREDLFFLLERLDLIPNQAEDVLRKLWIQKLTLPAHLRDDMIELAKTAVQTFQSVAKGVREVLGRNVGVERIALRIDSAESVGDQLEHDLVARVFASDIPTADKILQRDIVREVGSLCDLADDVGMLMNVINVKRRI